MKPIFTGLTPNAQTDDIIVNLLLLTAPALWQKGKSIAELEHAFRNFFGHEYVFSFDSGRTSLFSILKSLHLPSDAEVLLQAYTCVAVPDPVLWAGLIPIFVDIEKDTLNMSPEDLEKKITSKSKVLIIQHTFGFPADIEKLMAIAKTHNLFVIEDCAHALGATYQGKQVGTFGDAAFFSFGRDKVISSTFGAVAITRNKEVAINLRHIEQSFTFPRRAWIVKQLAHPSIMAKGKMFYNILSLGKIHIYLAKKLGLTTPAVYPQEKTGGKPPFVFRRLANALAAVAFKQFRKLDTLNAHRRKIAILYEVGLPTMAKQRALPDTEPIYLRYVIMHPKRDEIMAEAKKQNIFLGDWYTTAIAPVGVDYDAIKYNPSSCPNAEQAARETLNLPTDIHITEKDAQRIITFLLKWK